MTRPPSRTQGPEDLNTSVAGTDEPGPDLPVPRLRQNPAPAGPSHRALGKTLLAFGLGTLPGLFFVGTGASGLIRRYRRQSDLLAGILMIAIAVSLVVKALGALLGWE